MDLPDVGPLSLKGTSRFLLMKMWVALLRSCHIEITLYGLGLAYSVDAQAFGTILSSHSPFLLRRNMTNQR